MIERLARQMKQVNDSLLRTFLPRISAGITVAVSPDRCAATTANYRLIRRQQFKSRILAETTVAASPDRCAATTANYRLSRRQQFNRKLNQQVLLNRHEPLRYRLPLVQRSAW